MDSPSGPTAPSRDTDADRSVAPMFRKYVLPLVEGREQLREILYLAVGRRGAEEMDGASSLCLGTSEGMRHYAVERGEAAGGGEQGARWLLVKTADGVFCSCGGHLLCWHVAKVLLDDPAASSSTGPHQ